MRTPLLVSSLLAACAIGALFTLGIGRLTHGPSPAAGDADAELLSRLEERLRAVEGRLAELASLQAEGSVTMPGEDAPPPVPAEPEAKPQPEASEGEGEVALAARGDPEAPRPTKLERWLASNGMRQDMDDLVASVYMKTRDSRRQKEQEEAEARAREARELSEGPYGKHNYRINSLAKTLDLDERQKEYLHGLYTRYDERRKEVQKELALPDPKNATPADIEQQVRHLAQAHKQLGQELENDVLLGLTGEQQEAYKALPEHERGGGGGMNRFVFAADGGAAVAEWVGAEVRGAFAEPIKAAIIEKAAAQAAEAARAAQAAGGGAKK
ncbi:MAG: hypothetical protein HY721_12505 [Planctomycetes bacterium]|nr:hypothetical protein [Planctomycetota bacterium]